MQLVISTKEGKAYSTTVEGNEFNGKKIGDEIALDKAGLQGYMAKITGGSDKQGFPMRHDMPGVQRKKIFTGAGTGFKPAIKGQKKRVSIRGNTVCEETAQLNLIVTKQGSLPIEGILGKKEKAPEETVSIKEQMVKESLEHVGDVELAGDAHKVKGKIRR